jgi:thymidine kinase
MFSGKTQALMARLQSKQRAHKRVLVVKPELDTRFAAPAEIVSKQRTSDRFEKQSSMAAHPIKTGTQLALLVQEFDPDIIGVDEAQFFDDEISCALDVIAHKPCGTIGPVQIARNLDIYVAGLDLDAWGKPFGPMPYLLAVADHVDKFTANCFQCGQDARFTQKIGGSTGRIEVGADDLYEARCGECWTLPEEESAKGKGQSEVES